MDLLLKGFFLSCIGFGTPLILAGSLYHLVFDKIYSYKAFRRKTSTSKLISIYFTYINRHIRYSTDYIKIFDRLH